MQQISQYLAATLKLQRSERGWSLDQTAQKTGVSKAMLGQIERGESSPTLATLWKIASGFELSLSCFIEPPIAAPSNSLLRRASTLRHQSAPNEMHVATLFPFDKAFGFEVFELTMEPNTQRLSEAHAPGVTEHILVIEGDMEVLVDSRWNRLQKGDALRFSGDKAHGYRNTSSGNSLCHCIIHYS